MLGLRFGYPKLGHNGKLITLSWNCLRNSRCVPQKGRERESGFRKPMTHFPQPRYVVQPEKLCECASGRASALQSQPPQGWPAQSAAHVPTGCQLHGARAAPRGISPWQGWSSFLPHWPCLLEKAGLPANHLLFLWGFCFVLLFALTCLGVLRICVSTRHRWFSELLLTERESSVAWFASRMKWAWGMLPSLAGDWQAIELVVWVLVVLSPARWSGGNNNHSTLWGSKGRKISLKWMSSDKIVTYWVHTMDWMMLETLS